MRTSAARALAATAVSTLALGALGAAPAQAGGDHDGHDDDITIPLTERVSKELRDGDNSVRALGAADVWSSHGRIVLRFPLRGSGDDGRRSRHDDGKTVWALAGGLAFVGDGPTVTWKRLRINTERNVVTAVLDGGDRATILRFADKDRRHRGGSHGAYLRLTTSGAASLNAAADGAPFEAGDVFAGDRGCDR